MKTILLASVLLSAVSSSVFAADAVTPVAASTDFVWTGAYLGVQGGYAWTHGQLEVDNLTFFDSNLGGGLLGAHAGYNWQSSSNFVGGIELDVERVWNKQAFFSDKGILGLVAGDIGTDWQGSARLRAGFAVDRTLLFATGGVAMAHGFLDLAQPHYSESKTFVGWTAGAGIEHAFTDNWTGRLEYRYADFGSSSESFIFGFKQQSVRTGLSYKF